MTVESEKIQTPPVPALRRTGPIRPPAHERALIDPPISTTIAKSADTALQRFHNARVLAYHIGREGLIAGGLAALGIVLGQDPHFPWHALDSVTQALQQAQGQGFDGIASLAQPLKDAAEQILSAAKDIATTNPIADGITGSTGAVKLYDFLRMRREQLRKFARRQ